LGYHTIAWLGYFFMQLFFDKNFSLSSYLYNKNGQLIESRHEEGMIEYQYDSNGNLTNKVKTGNRLSNSGFEMYSGTNHVADSWIPWKPNGSAASFEVVDSGASSGKYAQQISSSNGSGNVSQSVRVEGGTAYTLSGRVQISGLSNGVVQAYVQYFDASGNYIGSTTVASVRNTGGWMTFSGGVTPPAGAVRANIILQLGLESGGAGTVQFDSIRFTTQEENMVSNPGFETRTGTQADDWKLYTPSGSTASFEVVDSGASSGKYAQQISSRNGSGNVSQSIRVEGGTAYTLSGRVQVSGLSNGVVQAYVQYFDVSGNYIGSTTAASVRNTGGWMTFSGGVTPPAGAVRANIILQLGLESGGAGTVQFDSIRFTTQEENMVSNPGFETRTGTQADDWKLYTPSGSTASFEVVDSGASSGKYAQQISSRNGSGNVSQSIRVEGGTAYTLSGRVQVSGLSNGVVQAYVQYFDVSGNYIGSTTAASVQNTGGWITFSGGVTPPAGAVRANIILQLGLESGGAGTVQFDDINLKPI
ncbi:carbohydrate binding domain-containing protein, partial [Paenibacillus sp. y28]|uniref:carbohydrate binding domain-containing protein n=1 Tax=Paenibacillus sp. y28 TaxID=3129110 RepID=UPI00301647B5